MTSGAFCIITDKKNQILLCLRNDMDIWNLPGGQIKKGESPWEAVKREAREEVGLKISIEKLLGIYYKKKQDDLVFQFLAIIRSGAPHLSEEVKEFAYFSKNNLPKNIAPLQQERILNFFEKPDLLVIKNQ